MKSMMMLAACLLALGAVGCGQTPTEKAGKKKAPPKVEEHAHAGPHGGPIAEWGEEEFHVELVVDRKAKTATAYILGPDVKKAIPIKTDKVKMTVKQPAFQLELKAQKQKDDPEGTASVFTAKDDRFGGKDVLEGTVSAEFSGKTYAGDFKEK